MLRSKKVRKQAGCIFLLLIETRNDRTYRKMMEAIGNGSTSNIPPNEGRPECTNSQTIALSARSLGVRGHYGSPRHAGAGDALDYGWGMKRRLLPYCSTKVSRLIGVPLEHFSSPKKCDCLWNYEVSQFCD